MHQEPKLQETKPHKGSQHFFRLKTMRRRIIKLSRCRCCRCCCCCCCCCCCVCVRVTFSQELFGNITGTRIFHGRVSFDLFSFPSVSFGFLRFPLIFLGLGLVDSIVVLWFPFFFSHTFFCQHLSTGTVLVLVIAQQICISCWGGVAML
jgi:hypothetical protein